MAAIRESRWVCSARANSIPEHENHARSDRFLLGSAKDTWNSHPAGTLRLADALIKAGKRFDMLIMPNVHHNSEWDPYSRRVQQNYLLEHLMHADLPDEPNVVPVGGYG